MFEFIRKNKAVAVVGGLALTAIVATPVLAQRDPAYAAARASGAIGEKPDGYLGYVSAPSASVKALVEDLNIKRKAAYTRKAQETNSTVEQFAFTSGCNLIKRTVSGEKYQAPDGSWQTRASADPVRDSRCP
ncbi:MAG: YdbL family protein [Parasphingorhabdus sp.]|uniref:YdbL family protein n=1 Tax=Parasphingorhabdus sp. TaxID=2709688 RepID=UPI003298E1DC